MSWENPVKVTYTMCEKENANIFMFWYNSDVEFMKVPDSWFLSSS